jgi:hypothetical protein
MAESRPDVALLHALVVRLDAIADRLGVVIEQLDRIETATLRDLKAALDRQADNRPRIEPMALRIEEVAAALGLSRRAIERERAGGRFVKPDLTIGKMPLWRVETVRAFLEGGGR